MKIKPRLYAQALALSLVEAKSTREGQEIMARFCQVLKENRQLKDWPKIKLLWSRFYDDFSHTAPVKIVGASELAPTQKQTILRFLQHQYPQLTLEPTFEVNPQLLGGFTIHIQDDFYDLTFRQQLNKFLAETK